MIKGFLFVFSLFISGLTLSVQAENADTPLLALLSELHSMQADFVQTNTAANGQIVRRSTGTVALLRPGKFRWDIKEPQPQQIMADGQQLWIYDPALLQASHRPLGKSDAATNPVALLSDSLEQVLTQYRIELLKNTPSQKGLSFKLIPRKSTGMLQWVILRFTEKKLTGMRVFDKLDQVTEFSFSRIKLNPSLSPVFFHFSPPPGVDVVNA